MESHSSFIDCLSMTPRRKLKRDQNDQLNAEIQDNSNINSTKAGMLNKYHITKNGIEEIDTEKKEK